MNKYRESRDTSNNKALYVLGCTSNSIISCWIKWIWKVQTTSPTDVDTPKSSASQMTSLSITDAPCCLESTSLLLRHYYGGWENEISYYVYCCSSWWAPICGTCLVIRAVLNIIFVCVCFSGAGGEVVMGQKCNVTMALRHPLPLTPYNK